MLDAYDGQVNAALFAMMNDETVGYIEYAIFENVYSISMIKVKETKRRQKIGTMMYRELERMAKAEGATIHNGYVTDDGNKFVRSL